MQAFDSTGCLDGWHSLVNHSRAELYRQMDYGEISCLESLSNLINKSVSEKNHYLWGIIF